MYNYSTFEVIFLKLWDKELEKKECKNVYNDNEPKTSINFETSASLYMEKWDQNFTSFSS